MVRRVEGRRQHQAWLSTVSAQAKTGSGEGQCSGEAYSDWEARRHSGRGWQRAKRQPGRVTGVCVAGGERLRALTRRSGGGHESLSRSLCQALCTLQRSPPLPLSFGQWRILLRPTLEGWARCGGCRGKWALPPAARPRLPRLPACLPGLAACTRAQPCLTSSPPAPACPARSQALAAATCGEALALAESLVCTATGAAEGADGRFEDKKPAEHVALGQQVREGTKVPPCEAGGSPCACGWRQRLASVWLAAGATRHTRLPPSWQLQGPGLSVMIAPPPTPHPTHTPHTHTPHPTPTPTGQEGDCCGGGARRVMQAGGELLRC